MDGAHRIPSRLSVFSGARAVVLAIFFVSGAAALGYQVLWGKYVLAFIGVSAYSYATVLAAFMGGLALGAWLLGRWADRLKSPLKLYAYLEIGVAAYAVAYPKLHGMAVAAYGWVVRAPADEWGGASTMWVKIVVTGLLLLPPTVLMGGTLPAMVRHATEHLRVVGRRVSRLYAINAFGSAFGALVMAFVLIPGLGLRASMMMLALVNLVVGLAALLVDGLSKVSAPQVDDETAEVGAGCSGGLRLEPWQVKAMLIAACVAGCLSFTLEIAWTRVFGLLLGSSSYSFALMLSAFISGIALGSLILSRFDSRVQQPLRLFGWCQVFIAVLVILPLGRYPHLHFLLQDLAMMFSQSPGAFRLYSASNYLICFLVMLPPTLFVGMSIPLLVKGLASSLEQLGRETGRVYAWNTAGNVLGSLLAGLVLLPMLGVEWLLRGAVMALAVLGLTVLVMVPRSIAAGAQGRPRLSAAVAVLVTLVVAISAPAWDMRQFTTQVFRRKATDGVPLRPHPGLEVLMAKDDPAGHLMVVRTPPERPREEPQISLFVGGKADASSGYDMPTQVITGHLPVLFHEAPRNVMVVGLASGVTAGSVLLHLVERLDVVEILRSMPEAATYFSAVNRQPEKDPRYHLIVDDARTYLSHTETLYDVIISEPSNPWVVGCAALFSEDFYRIVHNALRPGGLYLQWVQAYEMSDQSFCAVIRTFRRAFPFVYGFQGNASDVILIGSHQPLSPDWQRLRQRVAEPEVAAQLTSVGIPDLEALLFMQRYSPATVDLLAASTETVTTDDNLYLEYQGPRDLFRGLVPEVADTYDERQVLSPSLLWSQLRLAEYSERPMLSPYEPFVDPRLLHPVLTAVAGEVEFHHMRSRQPLMSMRSDLPIREDWLLHPPLSPGEIRHTVQRMLAEGMPHLAEDLAREHHQAIVHVAALSPTGGEVWRETVAEWNQQAPATGDGELRRLWIDVLAARGEVEGAALALSAWIGSENPPDAEWAVSRACRLDRGPFCRQVVALYADQEATGFLLRLRELVAGSEAPRL